MSNFGNETPDRFDPYLDGGGGVEQVLQAKVAAAVQVVFAEVLNELQVV